MEITETVAATRRACSRARMAAFGPDRLGLIAIHRALHEGHLSLVRRARAECGVVAVFLDQAGNPVTDEDTADADAERLSAAGVDVLFRPPAGALLAGVATRIVSQEDGPGSMPAEKLTCLIKLMHVCDPDKLYFGQRDGLAFAWLKRAMRDLAMQVELAGCPTIRDDEGLPLGSEALTNGERRSALVLPGALDAMQHCIVDGLRDRDTVVRAGMNLLKRHPELKVEYLEVLHPETLARVARLDPGTLVAVSVRIGRVPMTDGFIAE